MKRVHLASALLFLLVFTVAGPASAQTDTPTSTPTSTSTPVTVSTPTAVSTATPLPLKISNELNPSTHAKGSMLFDGGDLIVYPSADGGDLATVNEVIAPIREEDVVLGTMTNGSTETTLYTDDSPAGEWAAINATPVAVVTTATDHYKVGSASLKIAFTASAGAGDGAVNDITNDDLTSDEFIGFWARTSEQLAGGDLTLYLDDTTADTIYALPAMPPNKWVWVEIDISDLTGTRGDVVDKVSFQMSTAGALAHGAFNFWADGMYKWDAADEEALGFDVIENGLRSCLGIPTSAATANTSVRLALYTDFFVAYRTGNDSIVTITNQSANSGWCHPQTQ